MPKAESKPLGRTQTLDSLGATPSFGAGDGDVFFSYTSPNAGSTGSSVFEPRGNSAEFNNVNDDDNDSDDIDVDADIEVDDVDEWEDGTQPLELEDHDGDISMGEPQSPSSQPQQQPVRLPHYVTDFRLTIA